MTHKNILKFTKNILQNIPKDWINLTTHRLDIYNESLAKVEFLDEFEKLYTTNTIDVKTLKKLPTAYDYIRLGHPLSCVLEWLIAKTNRLNAENVISFDSKTAPILAVLRKNHLEQKHTQVYYTESFPEYFNEKIIKDVYGYNFTLQNVENVKGISETSGSVVYISKQDDLLNIEQNEAIDFYVSTQSYFGSVILVNGDKNRDYISEIQHVRRRETVAMTPSNSLDILKFLVEDKAINYSEISVETEKQSVQNLIQDITGTNAKPLFASSGLSIQYAIMMGLIDDAQQNHPEKPIKFIVPPNCYGGTNDQARRVAACLNNVDIVDLPVDGNNDMVESIEAILSDLAKQDAIPFIIAEIPTNPRVEVPDLERLKFSLSKRRETTNGKKAVAPVFILDQTFCPNFLFLGEGKPLSTVKAISYSSGSKFPSGGLCTAGYCAVNTLAEDLIEKIELHLNICDNEATVDQYKILAAQLPSMNQRIADAYKNTREFVDFIKQILPTAKINFVSDTLAQQGFTPSVFSLDLPTKGHTEIERETYKRALNHKLIKMMISEIPNESKYCVSYGQLKGCYWTIPATSTQGTTKEDDKDYIARVSVSGDMDLDKHKEVFRSFVDSI